MNYSSVLSCARDVRKSHALVLFLSLILIVEPLFVLHVSAQKRHMPRHEPSGKARRELTDNQRIEHVLARLSFGARPGDFERVKAVGVNAYLEQQLEPDTIDDTALNARLAKLPTLTLATPILIEQYNPPKPAPSPSPSSKADAPATVAANQNLQPASSSNSSSMVATAVPEVGPRKSMEEGTGMQNGMAKVKATTKPQPPARNPQLVVTELQRAAFLRAVYSERQLNEMVVDFWENHFNIFAQKDADRFLLTSFDRDVIRPFAFGRFRDLLGAVAHSPAMLFYLDNWQSSVLRQYPAANGRPARQSGGINENYARELMELHTMGVEGGYTQKDVQEVARCLTGWTIRKPNQEGLFLFNPAAHDDGAKTVLGQQIPPGGGIRDGERVLDILASHPSTARFIATKLARRFISDDPPASVIGRAADMFLKTDGSIRETLRVIITSPEFFSSAAYRAKIRSPFEYAVAATRALGAETDGSPQMLEWIARMGQPLFGKLTPEGYADRADQWLSTGELLNRLNFANALATNRIKGTQVRLLRFASGIDLNDARAVISHLMQSILNGEVTQDTKAALGKISNDLPESTVQAKDSPATFASASTGGNPSYPQKASTVFNGAAPEPAFLSRIITLIIGAPEFQRR